MRTRFLMGVTAVTLAASVGFTQAQTPAVRLTAAGTHVLAPAAAGERLTVVWGQCVAEGTTTVTFPFTAQAWAVSLTSSRAVIDIPRGALAPGVPVSLAKTGTAALSCAFQVTREGAAEPPPTPVDAVVSAWSDWAGGAWSVCSNGTQTRTETRTRTVVTPANGGATPALSETRTASQPCTVTPPPTPGTKTLLTPTDFRLLGFYDIQTAAMAYVEGFTARTVNGETRVIFLTHTGQAQEVALVGAYGSVLRTTTNAWQLPFAMDHRSVSWDQASGRLFTLEAVDYTTSVVPVQIRSHVLGAAGAVTGSVGPRGVQGVNAKRAFGGVLRIPADLQASLGGTWLVTGGGYTSLMAQGGGASMGLTAYAIGDPLVGSGDLAKRTLAEFPVVADWYAQGQPTIGDRGRRVTRPVNYYDDNYDGPPNGDPAGANPPPVPPTRNAWASPAPDGFGRWVWGDSYWNTQQWIETPTKRGFVAVFSGGGGKNWYGMSTTRSERRQYELHIFDPQHFVEAAAGARPMWRVQPTHMQELLLPGAGTQNPHPNPPGNTGNDSPPNGNVAGASYDPVTQRLLMMVPGVGASGWDYARVYVFAVD